MIDIHDGAAWAAFRTMEELARSTKCTSRTNRFCKGQGIKYTWTSVQRGNNKKQSDAVIIVMPTWVVVRSNYMSSRKMLRRSEGESAD
jgi:hypothetical protein